MNLFGSRKSLHDVIIGYRKPNTNHRHYLNTLLAEVKMELSANDFSEKYAAA
jgi:hypothetical protein